MISSSLNTRHYQSDPGKGEILNNELFHKKGKHLFDARLMKKFEIVLALFIICYRIDACCVMPSVIWSAGVSHLWVSAIHLIIWHRVSIETELIRSVSQYHVTQNTLSYASSHPELVILLQKCPVCCVVCITAWHITKHYNVLCITHNRALQCVLWGPKRGWTETGWWPGRILLSRKYVEKDCSIPIFCLSCQKPEYF